MNDYSQKHPKTTKEWQARDHLANAVFEW